MPPEPVFLIAIPALVILAPFFFVFWLPAITERILARREARRLEEHLARPQIDNIPLPGIDDHRWKLASAHPTRAFLGAFHLHSDGKVALEVDQGDGKLEMRNLGWDRPYADAVFARLDPFRPERLADIALKSIDEAK